MKTCIKCNIEKDDSQFNKGRNECKICQKEYKKLWRRNKSDIVKQYNKRYRQNNLELVRARGSERSKRWRQNNLEKDMLSRAKRRAKRDSIVFDLSEEELKIPETCPVLNIPLQRSEKIVSPNSPSLDRIIPEKGYVKGNIIVISNMANTIKQNATPEQIIAVGEFYKKLLEEAKKNE